MTDHEKGFDSAFKLILQTICAMRNNLNIHHEDHWLTFKKLGELETQLCDILDKEQQCNEK